MLNVSVLVIFYIELNRVDVILYVNDIGPECVPNY